MTRKRRQMLDGDVAKRQRDPPDMTLIVMLITLTGIGLGVLLSCLLYTSDAADE